jgi:hypothetical protein
VTSPEQGDPLTAFNEMLSEVIDTIFEAKQALRRVSSSSELHDVFSHLFDDLVRWKTLLSDRDQALGVSALSFISSAAGRRPPNLWPGNPTFEEVCTLVDEHLFRLANELPVVLSRQVDEGSRNDLAEVLRGINVQRDVLAKLMADDH